MCCKVAVHVLISSERDTPALTDPYILCTLFVRRTMARKPAAAPSRGHFGTDRNAAPQVVEMTTKQKLAAGREKARLAAFSKDARGSSAISSFFRKP